jgi:hypothetical protein
VNTFLLTNNFFLPPLPNTCITRSSNPANPITIAPYFPLDAGSQLNFTGPNGIKPQPKTSAGGYVGTIDTTGAYLSPGAYTVDNGASGGDIGPFKASLTFGTPFTWTNQSSVTAIPRAASQTITWTGADPSGYISISGISSSQNYAAQFLCVAPAAASSFTIPSYVLLALPATNSGNLAVADSTAAPLFKAPGLDFGSSSWVTLYMQSVSFQ